MYKLKIINYQPYEYQLLQNKLNQLGKSGYQSDDLSFFSIFKKTNQPVYYYIDFFQTNGKSRFEKRVSQERFYESYLQQDYQVIYKKKGMYVFSGQKPLSSYQPHLDHLHNLSLNRRNKNLLYAVISLFITLCLAMLFIETYNIDSLLTYGITFALIGSFLALLCCVYRCFINFYDFTHLYRHKEINVPTIQKHRLVYTILTCFSILLIAGGLIEDMFNVKSVSLNDHQLITLKDIGINKESQLIYQKRSSFTVPHCYSSLESTNQEDLLTKEYQFHSASKAKEIWEQFLADPHFYFCTSAKKKDHVIYGYHDQTLTTLIILQDKSVIMLTSTNSFNQDQVQKIIQFYA